MFRDFDHELIGVSQSIKRIRDLIQHVAGLGLNTVITGESGVGKEVVARNLYLCSPRKKKPFIKINCAALPEGLLESELFGYEKGAFTGAIKRTRGKFELAHSGVLMLDEICDMPLYLQAKLLHVLQSGEFSPLGSEKNQQSDTWVIAATNQELEKQIKQGLFREDLYYRLNTIKIVIPPLRNRPEDIPHLIHYFIKEINAQSETTKIDQPNQGILEKMMLYNWPGNVRELQNALKRYLVSENWDEIVDELTKESTVPDNMGYARAVGEGQFLENDWAKTEIERALHEPSFALKTIKKRVSQRVEKEVISYVLNQTRWNRSKARDILQISYKTLLTKIDELDIQQENGPAYERPYRVFSN